MGCCQSREASKERRRQKGADEAQMPRPSIPRPVTPILTAPHRINPDELNAALATLPPQSRSNSEASVLENNRGAFQTQSERYAGVSGSIAADENGSPPGKTIAVIGFNSTVTRQAPPRTPMASDYAIERPEATGSETAGARAESEQTPAENSRAATARADGTDAGTVDGADGADAGRVEGADTIRMISAADTVAGGTERRPDEEERREVAGIENSGRTREEILASMPQQAPAA